MTPSDKPAAMSSPSTGDKPSPGPMAAVVNAQARRLRRFELVCCAAAGLFTAAWALSLYFHCDYRASTSSIEFYDSVMRIRWWNHPVELDPGPMIRAGWIDRAGDLPWVERLGLALPGIDHSSRPTRYDSLSLDLPMWSLVGLYAAIAARFRRRRLHPDWKPRGTRLGAVVWTGVTLIVAAFALFAALGDLNATGARHYAAARMNRFAFVWSEYSPENDHRIPDYHNGQSLMERWAIEPPVFAATTGWRDKPELVACIPTWLVLLPCLLMTVQAWWQVTPIPPNLCKRCRYDLTGNTSGKCSECGRVIDWDIHGTRQ